MTLLTPLGLLGLLGIVALIIIYILKPNYQQKFVSTTFVWKLSLKYKKKRIPISKLRNFLIILCQILILTACALILAQPNQVLKAQVKEAEVIAIIDSSASMRTETDGKSRFERAVDDTIDLVEKTFSNDGIVSVIVAEESATFLHMQRATKEQQSDLIEALEALIKSKETDCAYGEADLEGAILLCEEVYAENPDAQIHLFSDTDYDYYDGINVNNVAQSGEWNAAILDAYTEMQSNYYVFVVEVAAYGANEPVEVEVFVQGANASSGAVDGITVSFGETVECSDDKSMTVVFVPEELYQENPARYDNVYDVVCWTNVEKIYSYQTIHIELNEDDNFKDDDSFDIYNGQKEVLKVQYASSTPNTFFTSVLTAIQSVYKNRWDIEITEVKEGTQGAVEGFDFYIFEHEMPATMPADGVVFLVNPDEAPNGAGFSISKPDFTSGKQGIPLTEAEDSAHPILNNLTADNITITRCVNVVNMEGTYQRLWECDSKTVLAVKDEPNEKVILMPFSLHYSNLPLLVDFPVLMYNLFEYFFPVTVSGNSFEVNEKVSLNARGEELVVSKGDYVQSFTEFPGSLSVTMPGQYELSQTTWAKKDIVEHIFVKIPAVESYITQRGDSLVNPYKASDISEYFEDLMFYIAAAMTALLFIEWWLSSRDTM